MGCSSKDLCVISRRRAAWACAVIFCSAVLMWLPLKDLIWDEPHIFYQYAKNFASGQGLVFNRDERILGFTSPLYQMVLAIIAVFYSNLPFVGNLLFMISLAGLGIVVFLALQRIELGILGFFTAMGLIVWPTPYNYMGMETLTLAFLVFSSFYFMVRDRFTLAAVFISLALLTRFDGVIAAAVLLVAYIVRERKCPWKLMGIGVTILLPWFIFSRLYYGTILPQTFYAKRNMLTASQFLVTIWRHGFLFNSDIDYNTAPAVLPAAGIILAVMGIIFGVRKGRYFSYIACYSIGTAAGYAFFARTEEPWPIFPFALGMRIFLFCGIYSLAIFLGRLPRPAKWEKPVCAIIMLIISSPFFIEDFCLLRSKPDSAYMQYLFVARMSGYKDAGAWLRSNTPPDTTVYTPEPGSLAYYSGRIFFDYYGLVTTRGWNVPWDKVGEDLRPDYVVLPDNYLGQGAHAPPGYEVIRTFEASPYPPVRISRRQPPIKGER